MKSTLRNMTLSLGGIAIGVAALLGAVNLLTAGPISDAAARRAREAVAEVLPPFDNDPMASAVTIDGCEVYPAMMDGQAAGAAVRVSTMDGFNGLIVVMAGFDAHGTLTGYRVLEQAETPGLGAQADGWFRTEPHSIVGTSGELVVSKDATLSGDDGHSGASHQAGDDGHSGASHRAATQAVDGITAATITSRAFLGAVNRARRAYHQYQESCKR